MGNCSCGSDSDRERDELISSARRSAQHYTSHGAINTPAPISPDTVEATQDSIDNDAYPTPTTTDSLLRQQTPEDCSTASASDWQSCLNSTALRRHPYRISTEIHPKLFSTLQEQKTQISALKQQVLTANAEINRLTQELEFAITGKYSHLDKLGAYTKLLEYILDTWYEETEEGNKTLARKIETATHRGEALSEHAKHNMRLITRHRNNLVHEMDVRNLSAEEMQQVEQAWETLQSMFYQQLGSTEILKKMEVLQQQFK